MGNTTCIQRLWSENQRRGNHLENLRGWEDDFKMDFKEIGCKNRDWIHLV
jgi:hypothetical protein